MDIQRTITGPEPVSLIEMKSWLKVDFSTEDTLIAALITEVREHIEQFTGRSLVASSIVLTVFGEADEPIYLPFPDIDEVTESIPDTVVVKGGKRKYVIFGTNDEYRIAYTTLGNCPAGVKLAIKKAVAENYINRQNTTELTAVKLPESTYHFLMQYTLP